MLGMPEIQLSKLKKKINPFPTRPWFLRVFSTSLLKTLWERRFCSLGAILLFPQCVLLFWRIFHHFHQIQNCSLQTLSAWKGRVFHNPLVSLNFEGFDPQFFQNDPQNLLQMCSTPSTES